MARLLLMIVTLYLLLIHVAGAAQPATNHPEDARLITSDIDHFWEAFDAMSVGDSLAALQTQYFDRASQGLEDFPDVYFLVGRMSSGGTTSDAGLLIGVEMYGLSEDTPREELGMWHQRPRTRILPASRSSIVG